ncbi:unnamed protein product [Prorocentrum cordatum]|uniref:Major facilitator superfamily (MFS) profile domain-containing protein n=1 Tax=Prorocentrum cordatum TaxID=2364126 RepID=A0ABN9X9U6_9DINO|nr:unnamed protein product [Polarella glacialis]
MAATSAAAQGAPAWPDGSAGRGSRVGAAGPLEADSGRLPRVPRHCGRNLPHCPGPAAPLAAEFGATEYGISWLPALFQLSKGLLTLPGGYAAHRFGAVRCLRLGAVVVTAASLCYPFAQGLRLLGALHAVYGAAYDFCGIATFIVFTTSWFERHRALAIGILVTAFSIAGAVFPPVVALVAARHGWRAAAALCPVAMVAVVVPLVFGVLGDGPLAGQHAPQQLPRAGEGDGRPSSNSCWTGPRAMCPSASSPASRPRCRGAPGRAARGAGARRPAASGARTWRPRTTRPRSPMGGCWARRSRSPRACGSAPSGTSR